VSGIIERSLPFGYAPEWKAGGGSIEPFRFEWSESGFMIRVLLIAGNKNIRNFIRRELSKGGHMVLEAADGQEALGQFKDNSPEALIIDIHTKKKKALETFRQKAIASRLPVIILTSKIPDEPDVSNWNPAVILDRWSRTPDILSVLEKLSVQKTTKKQDAQDKTSASTNKNS
jgi:CheY-like chemotaxis protein